MFFTFQPYIQQQVRAVSTGWLSDMTDISIADNISTQEHDQPEVLTASELDELTSLFSHELRTPLTSIRGALGLLLSGRLGTLPQQSQRLLEIAANNTDRLVRLTTVIESDLERPLNLLTATAIARFQLEKDLQLALKHQEFQLYYQPIVALETDQITGFEVLVRWQHPQRGLISPAEFIPLAEETGLIQPLGVWVLREACYQLKSWQQQFPRNSPLTMSVNFSSKQLSQPNIVEKVEQILQETGVVSGSLRLEITESAIMENPVEASATLHQLKSLGIQLYMDDFGTGYSSLSRLHDLPIDVLKIDRVFVSQNKWNIIWTIMILALSLGLEVIVEGVETAEELAQLRMLGCKHVQGYFFSKPVNKETAEALICSDSIKHLKIDF